MSQSSSELIILDPDLAQSDEYACDFSKAACMYSKIDNEFKIAPEIVDHTYEMIKRTSANITIMDVKFLICRTPLGPMQSSDYPLSKVDTCRLLASMERFVNS